MDQRDVCEIVVMNAFLIAIIQYLYLPLGHSHA